MEYLSKKNSNATNYQQLLKNYSEINNSYKRTLTFHLGTDAGFFSEFNNMVLAILYCLQNRIRFKLYSQRGNLAIKKGWQDYFLPFCPETSFYFHNRYNRRSYQIKKAKTWPPVLLKLITSNHYLTQDVWNLFRNREFENSEFDIRELGLKNTTLLESAQTIIKMIWHYNETAKNIINDFKASIPLPENYISIHIRAGDKSKEKEIYNVERYMEEAAKLNICKNAFVLTDDYHIIQELNLNYPEWKFLTLCSPSEKGYLHSEFVNLSRKEKYLRHLKLLANIDICASSKHFIGTFSSGPGTYLAMRLGEEKCTGIDYNSWMLW